MTKQEFLTDLRDALSGLEPKDIDERIAFYGEMIDDRVEEGADEEDAVAGIGSVDEIGALWKTAKEKTKSKRSSDVRKTVWIVAGFPVWIAAGAVVLSLYIAVWVLIVSLWAIEVSLWVCVPVGFAAAAVYVSQGNTIFALMMIGMAFFCAGLSIFTFFGCVAAVKGALKLMKKLGAAVKSCFTEKENET